MSSNSSLIYFLNGISEEKKRLQSHFFNELDEFLDKIFHQLRPHQTMDDCLAIKKNIDRVIGWFPSNSDHQDYHMFSREHLSLSILTFHFY